MLRLRDFNLLLHVLTKCFRGKVNKLTFVTDAIQWIYNSGLEGQ